MAHEEPYPEKRKVDWNGNPYIHERLLRVEKILDGNGSEGLVTKVSNLQLMARESLDTSKENSRLIKLAIWTIVVGILGVMTYNAYLNGSFNPPVKVMQVPEKSSP